MNFKKVVLLSLLILFMSRGLSFSGVSDSISLKVMVDNIPPASITDLVALPDNSVDGNVDLFWTAPGDNNYSGLLPETPYVIKWATRSVTELGGSTTSWWELTSNIYVPSWNPVLPGTQQTGKLTYDINALYPGVKYYFAIKARDKGGNWSKDINVSEALAGDAIPGKVENLKGNYSIENEDYRITLTWNELSLSKKGVDFQHYRIYRATVTSLEMKVEYYFIGISTINTYNDVFKNNLQVGVSVYYSVTAVDGPPLIQEGELSDSFIIYIPYSGVVDLIKPYEPTGIKGTLSEDYSRMTISWAPVTKNEDGTVCNDLFGYRIYRASSLNGPYTAVATVSKDETSWTDPESVLGITYYYYVTAFDNSLNESERTMIVDSSRNTNLIETYKGDYRTNIFIQKNISSILYAENNEYNSNLKIQITRNTEKEKQNVLKSVNFNIFKPDDETIVKDLKFGFPDVLLTVSYPDISSYVPGGTEEDDWAKKNLCLYWFNGIKWIRIGGEVDNQYHIITVRTERLGTYEVRITTRFETFGITDVQPDKIFTPNQDGWNDYIEIFYANPKKGFVTGKIYDLKGRFIADMKRGSTGDSLIWDGKNNSGKDCSGGIYIYQIEVTGPENKVINGTCVIAR